MPTLRRPLLLALSLLLATSGLLTGCGNAGTHEIGQNLAMTPLQQMPVAVQSVPLAVQQAYQVSFANPDVLQRIPCYCGCGAMGHTSNYDCYVADVDAAGAISFDPHALGCSICVDITQDVMRLFKQGQSIQDIRAYIDLSYSKYGPSNMP